MGLALKAPPSVRVQAVPSAEDQTAPSAPIEPTATKPPVAWTTACTSAPLNDPSSVAGLQVFPSVECQAAPLRVPSACSRLPTMTKPRSSAAIPASPVWSNVVPCDAAAHVAASLDR